MRVGSTMAEARTVLAGSVVELNVEVCMPELMSISLGGRLSRFLAGVQIWPSIFWNAVEN